MPVPGIVQKSGWTVEGFGAPALVESERLGTRSGVLANELEHDSGFVVFVVGVWHPNREYVSFLFRGVDRVRCEACRDESMRASSVRQYAELRT
jgi:hypothetical protein